MGHAGSAAGTLQEHLAVNESRHLDVSHMGGLEIRGATARKPSRAHL
jgi:glycine cleavage system aminomethyltransferase T